MVFIKYILPALAASQLAFASSDCGDTTIETQTDASGISSCTSIDGDITIKESYSGSLDLGSIEKIDGTLTCVGGANVTGITAASLETITGNFTLKRLTTLTTLSFAKLSSVGAIDWEVLPGVNSLDFTTGITDVGDVNIIDTHLTSLDGITLKKVGQLDITENSYLKSCNISNLEYATGQINFQGNYDSLEIDLPNLTNGTSMTFRNISSINIPKLKTLTGQLGFWNTDFDVLYAPDLTETGDVVFTGNTKLTNVSLPALKTVDGGISISRNDKLQEIDLPKLSTVSGAIDLTGNFYMLKFGSLTRVDGAFNVESSNGTFSCSDLKSEYKSDVRGSWTCKTNDTNPTTSNGKSGTESGSSSSGGSSDSTSSSAAMANGLAAPVAGIAAVFYALAQLV
ncbi:Leucine rich repeat 5 [Penicillium angulare]|uniref:Leucine rich repeat 5 n=1 Tax=Penicillium angulare TaxID=116970 RepID=UPI002541093E|nr:Leucine rich repeat 5 [Penicillium angulare]KAJ5281482.1 Leucine rich repeat 5 [Penicillium angulare]